MALQLLSVLGLLGNCQYCLSLHQTVTVAHWAAGHADHHLGNCSGPAQLSHKVFDDNVIVHLFLYIFGSGVLVAS
jgi:hypothetical protein